MPAALRRIAPSPMTEDSIEGGYHVFDRPSDADAVGAVLARIKSTCAFDQSLFLAEAESDADP